MKKKLLASALIVGLTLGSLLGCQSTKDSKEGDKTTGETEDKTITIGAGITPHSEILGVVKEELAEKGYDLKIVEYNDYILPNTALEDGDLDANYFQHQPYLEEFNAEKGTHLVSVAAVHFEPLGIYAGKTKSLDKLQKGATVAVPNDTTNEARALLLLEQEGLIKLKKDAGLKATVLDMEENPFNLQINELEAAQVARAINDVDIACVNGNYAIGAELDDPIATESVESQAAETYANIIAVREGEEDSAKTKALVAAILSDRVRDFINEKYIGTVVPMF